MPRIKKLKIHNWETARVVADMLTENTGAHILDSGGYSGRAWQRNQAAVKRSGHSAVAFFESLPESQFGWPCVHPHENFRDPDFKVKGGTDAELWVKHNVYHWLKQAVTYAPEVDKALDELAAEMDAKVESGEDTSYHDTIGGKPSWFEIYRAFPEWYANKVAEQRAEEERETRRNGGYSEEEIAEVTADNFYEKPTGIYGDGGGYAEGYTYNEENCLSQDIHWIFFHLDQHDDGIALVMIHGGADARGGFTRPRAFYASEEGDSPTWFDWNRWGIGCTECSAIWSDNGGEWNGSDDGNQPEILSLGDYNAREGDKLDAAFLNATTGVLVGDEKPWIVIDQDGAQYPSDPGVKVYCPHCGVGELQAWYY